MKSEQMPAPQKFMFDNSFDNTKEVIDPLVELKARFEEKIEKAKAEAFAEGRLTGEKEALATIESQTKDALEKIANQEQKIQENYNEELKKLEAKAIEFGIAAGTTLAGDLIRKEPMPLIENFFKEAFEIVRGVPQLTARITPNLAQNTKEASKAWMSESGYTGELEIIEDANLKECDVAITWKDGGISQNVDEIMNSIKSALNNFFASKEMAISGQTISALSTEQPATAPIEPLNKSENSS
ncbi:hypothetical protein NBRC116602_05870 [Hyphomicrobiales bacterium 4NK60-0047b]|jgi:flagellar biosynthesis/type III secretory pathway protein FliH